MPTSSASCSHGWRVCTRSATTCSSLKADMNDAAQVAAAVDAAIARFGRIDLLVHGAARIDAGAFALRGRNRPEVMEAQFSPKLRGLFHLMEALRGREPRRLGAALVDLQVLGGLGLAAYSGANAVLDAMAVAGGGALAQHRLGPVGQRGRGTVAGHAESRFIRREGDDAFLRLLGADVGSRALVVVSDLAAGSKAWVRHDRGGAGEGGPASSVIHDRTCRRRYEEPRTATEQRARRDLGRAAGDRRRSASTIASSISAGTPCWRYKSRPRSGIASRSSCRC